MTPAEEGEESLDKALALWQRLVEDDSPWPSHGPDGRHEQQPGQPHGPPDNHPQFLDDNRKLSEHYRQEAVELLERLVADHPEVPGYLHLLARCYRETPAMWAGRGVKSDAGNLDKATRILENLANKFPDVADYRYDLSETYAMRGDQGWPGQEPPDKNAAQQSPKCSIRR